MKVSKQSQPEPGLAAFTETTRWNQRLLLAQAFKPWLETGGPRFPAVAPFWIEATLQQRVEYLETLDGTRVFLPWASF